MNRDITQVILPNGINSENRRMSFLINAFVFFSNQTVSNHALEIPSVRMNMFLLTGLRPRNADEFNLNQSAIAHMLALSRTLYII